MSATRTEQITGLHGQVITTTVDDLRAVHVLAARREQPAPPCLRTLAVELGALRVTVSAAQLVEIASRVLVAQTYSEVVGLIGLDPVPAAVVDVRD